jgi:hypothetical protein
MKTINVMGMSLLLFLSCLCLPGYAQENTRPEFVGITRTHWNLQLDDATASDEEWEALTKEYNEKVTKKNEFIMSTAILSHMYTDDNSEVLLITTYKNWDAIEKAQARNTELENAAWPDKTAREALFKKADRYFVNRHSDEIYRTIEGAKIPAAPSDSSMVAYMQKTYLAFPADGTTEEFNALHKEYLEKTVHKNPHIIAFYPLRHGWGADNREIVTFSIVKSFGDVGAMNQAIGGLIEKGWPDETARKAFFKKYDRYFTGQHGDYIYSTIPGVSK